MSAENPERLFVMGGVESHTAMLVAYCQSDRGIAEADSNGQVTEYVRADIAAAREAAVEAKYKGLDAEVMRVALADLRRIRACFVVRANALRRIGEEERATGLEDAVKQLDEEIFT